MGKTSIEWCDFTFNPWTGCQKVGPGCDHCYAESWAKRTGQVGWGVGQQRRRTSAAYWRQPEVWNRRVVRRDEAVTVFCGSLCDWADNKAPAGARHDLHALWRRTPNLLWMTLTKRAGNLKRCLPLDWGYGYPNVALMITVVNQEEADRDIPVLMSTWARWRGLSIEPMLEMVDLAEWPDLDFVIAGGESGPHARPAHPLWFRCLRDQCREYDIPFLFKQWGEWAPVTNRAKAKREYPNAKWATVRPVPYARSGEVGSPTWPENEWMVKIGKKAAGRRLDGREHNAQPPEFSVPLHRLPDWPSTA